MAVKSINNSVAPDGIVSTILVFEAIPRLGIPSDRPAPLTFKRAVAVCEATEEMSRHFARR